VGPSELKLKNVIEYKYDIKDEISQIKEVNKDILDKYLFNPIKLTTATTTEQVISAYNITRI
jgi:hypothetical protein